MAASAARRRRQVTSGGSCSSSSDDGSGSGLLGCCGRPDRLQYKLDVLETRRLKVSQLTLLHTTND